MVNFDRRTRSGEEKKEKKGVKIAWLDSVFRVRLVPIYCMFVAVLFVAIWMVTETVVVSIKLSPEVEPRAFNKGYGTKAPSAFCIFPRVMVRSTSRYILYYLDFLFFRQAMN